MLLSDFAEINVSEVNTFKERFHKLDMKPGLLNVLNDETLPAWFYEVTFKGVICQRDENHENYDTNVWHMNENCEEIIFNKNFFSFKKVNVPLNLKVQELISLPNFNKTRFKVCKECSNVKDDVFTLMKTLTLLQLTKQASYRVPKVKVNYFAHSILSSKFHEMSYFETLLLTLKTFMELNPLKVVLNKISEDVLKLEGTLNKIFANFSDDLTKSYFLPILQTYAKGAPLFSKNKLVSFTFKTNGFLPKSLLGSVSPNLAYKFDEMSPLETIFRICYAFGYKDSNGVFHVKAPKYIFFTFYTLLTLTEEMLKLDATLTSVNEKGKVTSYDLKANGPGLLNSMVKIVVKT